ncbi:MAG: TerB family tellurite resistance protein [Mesorhizobium sp.]|nr:TerB family tellurite resistance protein [Mesorhizobium sp.]MBN9243851.1 TerB family tellurite resistance protein [Mesorhizobium sp.]
MFERVLSFLKDLPGGARARSAEDEARVAAAALLFHVMDADGVRQDVEWERFKQILADAYSISGEELAALARAGEKADDEAVDLYAFTSVLKRSLDADGRKAFVELLWEMVYADGELDELEDNVVWRIAELIGVERRDRIEARRKVAAKLPATKGASGDE